MRRRPALCPDFEILTERRVSSFTGGPRQVVLGDGCTGRGEEGELRPALGRRGGEAGKPGDAGRGRERSAEKGGLSGLGPLTW